MIFDLLLYVKSVIWILLRIGLRLEIVQKKKTILVWKKDYRQYEIY